MIFETYSMITPNNKKCEEYNEFYKFYSMSVKYNIIFGDMIYRLKNQLPYLSVEIKDKIERKNKDIDNNLLAMGIERIKTTRENFNLSISNNDLQIREQYFNADYDKFINFISDYYQVIQLYANFESTIKLFIFRKKGKSFHIKQKDLITELFNVIQEDTFINKYYELNGMDFNKTDFENLWNYYTNIRNLYSHSSGIISKEFISKMNNIRVYMKKLEEELNSKYIYIFDNETIFNTDNILSGELYIISEYELRIFRNFLLYIWETIYMLETNNENEMIQKVSLQDNRFNFKLANTYEKGNIMNEIPETITEEFSNIYVSGYECPICKNGNAFLYKTLFNKELLINEIFNDIDNNTFKCEKAFTCVICKTIFLPKAKNNLSDNDGMNIVGLNDEQYLKYLKILNKIGSNIKR